MGSIVKFIWWKRYYVKLPSEHLQYFLHYPWKIIFYSVCHWAIWPVWGVKGLIKCIRYWQVATLLLLNWRMLEKVLQKCIWFVKLGIARDSMACNPGNIETLVISNYIIELLLPYNKKFVIVRKCYLMMSHKTGPLFCEIPRLFTLALLSLDFSLSLYFKLSILDDTKLLQIFELPPLIYSANIYIFIDETDSPQLQIYQ